MGLSDIFARGNRTFSPGVSGHFCPVLSLQIRLIEAPHLAVPIGDDLPKRRPLGTVCGTEGFAAVAALLEQASLAKLVRCPPYCLLVDAKQRSQARNARIALASFLVEVVEDRSADAHVSGGQARSDQQGFSPDGNVVPFEAVFAHHAPP
jgi:hypothetical protein